MSNFNQKMENCHFYTELSPLDDQEKFDSTNEAFIDDDVFEDLKPKNISTKNLTILDRLIKCHPIWYLPHVGRTAANHILMPQKPGTFVVRHSSHSRNSRALSVRLQNNPNNIDVEHYLIEILNKAGKIRLHGSEKSFSALPFLIEHYFEADKCKELPIKLSLPDKIMECKSNRELCSLALLGQDFWSSPQPKAHRTFSLSVHPSASKFNAQASTKRSGSVKLNFKSSIWYRNLEKVEKKLAADLFLKEPQKYLSGFGGDCVDNFWKNDEGATTPQVKPQTKIRPNLSSFKPKLQTNLDKFAAFLRRTKLEKSSNCVRKRLSAPNLVDFMKKLKTNSTQLCIIEEKLALKAKSLENVLASNEKCSDSDYGLICEFKKESRQKEEDQISNCGTLFSEPWDSSGWQNLVEAGDGRTSSKTNLWRNGCQASNTLEKRCKRPTGILVGDRRCNGQPLVEDVAYSAGNMAAWTLGTLPKRVESKSDQNKFNMGPVLSPARFRDPIHKNNHRLSADPSFKIQVCVENLSLDLRSFFAVQIRNFIDCTLQAREDDPQVVIGNVRQFMNGLKNYLVKQGESTLHSIIEFERSKLKADEFLNIDAILEIVLEKIILQKLKPHLYKILMANLSKNQSLKILSENFNNLRSRNCQELGITFTKNVDPPLDDKIRNFLRKMQSQYSPLKKLENLLEALSHAYHCSSASSSKAHLPSGDTLLNWLIYLLSQYNVVGCELECTYMRGLLQPSLLSGEASYYLAAFSSAVHVLKHLDLLPGKNQIYTFDSPNSSECLLKVAIPNEIFGTIAYQSFPLAPQFSVQKFCKMIAHKCCVTNPEDYGLYLLVDGFETCLLQNESPYLINEQLQMAGASRMFVYKRHEAKIAWPKSESLFEVFVSRRRFSEKSQMNKSSSTSTTSKNGVKKATDEKNVKLLRELATLNSNRQCFDCNQRGPTYVNITIGSFVCTSCSGRLRGLNPPHRVKSISMANFKKEEIDFVRLRGNEYCRKVWMGKFDKSRASIDETSFKDETQMKDFLSLKYEKKRWYVDPNAIPLAAQAEQSVERLQTTKPLSAISEDPFFAKLQEETKPAENLQNQQQADFANFDAFLSNGYSAPKQPLQQQQKPMTDLLSSLSPIPKSQTLPAVVSHQALLDHQPQPLQDKYSALKELDELFSNNAPNKQAASLPVNNPVPASTSWSSAAAGNVNPFFNGHGALAPTPQAPTTTNPFLMPNQATNFAEQKLKAWNPFMN